MAEGDYLGTVTYVGTLGDGTVFVELPFAISIGGCSSPQVRIPASHPARKEFLAIAMSAYLTGTLVKIQTDSCMGSYPTLGNSTNSWIYLRQ
jgi:hypothetical protein